MARGRWLKPEAFTDPKLGRVTRDARLLYFGLWTEADDAGHVIAEPGPLRARLFSFDDLANDDVERWIQELAAQKRILLYEANGERYARIPTFTRHQSIKHPSKWRNPEPPDDIEKGLRD